MAKLQQGLVVPFASMDDWTNGAMQKLLFMTIQANAS
jgi:hypothetical protein